MPNADTLVPEPDFQYKTIIPAKWKVSRDDPRSDFPKVAIYDGADTDYSVFRRDTRSSKDGSLDGLGAEHDKIDLYYWLEAIDLVVTCDHPEPEIADQKMRLGLCRTKLLRRKMIRSRFYEEVSASSGEHTLLAFNLFDRYGRLKDDYKHHEVRKGLGMWQDPLDDGDILLIEKISVDEDFRRCGLGTKMIKMLFDVTRKKTKGGKFVAVLGPQPSKDRHFNDFFRYIVSDSGNLFRPPVLDHGGPASNLLGSIPWM
jgi:hypothetical protein